MQDNFDMTFCFRDCFGKRKGDYLSVYSSMFHIEHGDDISDSEYYCPFELKFSVSSKARMELFKLLAKAFNNPLDIGRYFKKKSGFNDSVRKLVDFMKEHVRLSDNGERWIKKHCPYYTEVMLHQWNGGKKEKDE